MERTATFKHYQASQVQNAYRTTNFNECKVTNDLETLHRKTSFNYPYASLARQEAFNYVGKSHGRPPSTIDLHTDFNGSFDGSLTSTNKINDRMILKPDKTPRSFLP
jgi:hypothetical protein